jgi:hypothetical protein
MSENDFVKNGCIPKQASNTTIPSAQMSIAVVGVFD